MNDANENSMFELRLAEKESSMRDIQAIIRRAPQLSINRNPSVITLTRPSVPYVYRARIPGEPTACWS
jgi:hypothetical protein